MYLLTLVVRDLQQRQSHFVTFTWTFITLLAWDKIDIILSNCPAIKSKCYTINCWIYTRCTYDLKLVPVFTRPSISMTGSDISYVCGCHCQVTSHPKWTLIVSGQEMIPLINIDWGSSIDLWQNSDYTHMLSNLKKTHTKESI